MNLNDFMNALAQSARKEQIVGASPRDAVLRRLHGGGAVEEEQRSLFWVVAISGAAACITALVSLDAYRLLTDPLGLFIGILV